MTDIYVGGRRQANRGCLILLLILAAIIGLGWFMLQRRQAQQAKPPSLARRGFGAKAFR